MNAITAKEQAAVARPLKVLVPLIQEDIAAARDAEQRAGVPYYKAAGEKLIEAKDQVKHGDWAGWVKRNFGVTQQTAGRWMRLAEATNGKLNARVQFETLSSFTDPNRDSGHRVSWHDPVRQVVNTVNIARLTQDRQDREKESRLERELAVKLIDIGYKALAAKLHPDKGGSTEAMARLNRVKSDLRRCIGG